MAKPNNSPNAHPEEFWHQIAYEYTKEVNANGIRGATGACAERRGVPRNTYSGWIRQARLKGFLVPYSERVCHLCRQPLVPEPDAINMETWAGDFAEKSRELGLLKAATAFENAMEALMENNMRTERLELV